MLTIPRMCPFKQATTDLCVYWGFLASIGPLNLDLAQLMCFDYVILTNAAATNIKRKMSHVQ